jgi:hypothetical protein
MDWLHIPPEPSFRVTSTIDVSYDGMGRSYLAVAHQSLRGNGARPPPTRTQIEPMGRSIDSICHQVHNHKSQKGSDVQPIESITRPYGSEPPTPRKSQPDRMHAP